MTGDGARLTRAARGEDEALAELAAAWRPESYRAALAVLGDAQAAEDVAQEAMIRLQTSVAGFRGESELGTWLYRVTLNLCYDHFRRVRRRREGGPPPKDVAGAPVDPHDRVDAERARAALHDALQLLTEEQREAVVLRYVSDLSYAEIARTTGVAPGTVASRIFRALRRLGTEMENKHLEILR